MRQVFKGLKAIGESLYLNLYEITYENKKNRLKTWMVASRKPREALEAIYRHEKDPYPDAVIILAIHEPSKKLVLIRQFRVPVNDYIYELPAGLLEKDESIIACVRRELNEETGLSLNEILEISPLIYGTAGMSDESFKIVTCTCKGQISHDYLEEDEDIEAMLVDKNQIENLLDEAPSMDMKAYYACKQYLQSHQD